MNPLIQQNLSQVADLCGRFGVEALDVFGSAASDAPLTPPNDLDFLVEFSQADSGSLFHRYFGLMEALEQLFDRKIDLVSAVASTNPYFIASVNQSLQPVYASPRAQAA